MWELEHQGAERNDERRPPLDRRAVERLDAADRRRRRADRRNSAWRPYDPERRRGLTDRRTSGHLSEALLTPLPLSGDLLSLVSHELRTPITTIQGYAELLGRRLQRRDAEYELTGPVGVISAEIRRLAQLVDELLLLSELSHPNARLHTSRVDLSSVVTEVVASFQAPPRKHTLRLNLTPPMEVQGDPTRLRQLVEHLVQNSVKYSPEGGEIELKGWATDRHVLLLVVDHGIGIEPQHLPRIFEPFYQSEAPSERQFGGLGLGLTLARAIAEHHRGQVWAESAPGQGSTFFLRLPRADGAPREE